jgi:sugar-specific transcriptional regulator TrmB
VLLPGPPRASERATGRLGSPSAGVIPITDPPADQPAAAALLEQLGLSQYDAASYVALLRLGEGTAREISETADVPRTRIYDAVERLQERGLVDVQHASPKVFRPVARETAIRQFQREYDETFTQLSERLTALDPVDQQQEQPAVWTTTGRAAVDERVHEALTAATDEIVYLAVEAVLTDESLAHLRAASERGVTVRIADGTAPTHETIQAAVPAAELVEPPWAWHTPPTGRLLMTDRETVLMSTLSDGDGPAETAIWGQGPQNSLVTVLETIVAWWLEPAEPGATPGE